MAERALLTRMPVAIRIEDFSGLLPDIMRLLASGAGGKACLPTAPEPLEKLVNLVDLSWANEATIRLYDAPDEAGLRESLRTLRRTSSFLTIYRDALQTFADGALHFRRERTLRIRGSLSRLVDTTIFVAEEDWTSVAWVEQDVTSHWQAQAELRLREERLKTVVANAPVAITLEDIDGHLLLANPTAQALFRLGSGATGAKFAEVCDLRRELVELLEDMSRAAVDRDDLAEREITMTPSGGGPAHVVAVKFPVSDAERQTIAVGLVASDVTEQRNAEQQARRLAEELAHAERRVSAGEMSAALSHELNQPLATIVNYARGAMRQLRAAKMRPDEIPPFLEQIALSAERASGIIRSLREFLERKDGAVADIDINEIVDKATQLAAASVTYHGIVLHRDFALTIPPVRAEQIALEQAVLNLITNAIEAMAETPPDLRQLSVLTRPVEHDAAEIAVSDSGPGLPEELREKVFEPFMTTKAGGTGLGLSISQTLVQRYGGTLSAERNAARGETFRIVLPTRRPAPEEAEAQNAGRST